MLLKPEQVMRAIEHSDRLARACMAASTARWTSR